MPLTNFILIICRFHLASFIPVVAISRPSQLLHDIQLWMHSWGFSFQLNASRNKISENGFTLADSDLKAFPKKFYGENTAGFKPQTRSSGLQFEFGFHCSYHQQCKNPSKGVVFSKKGLDLWNVLVFLIQWNFKVQYKLAFLDLTNWNQQSPYLYPGLQGFPFMEIFTRLPYRVLWGGASSVVLWNFA